MKVLYSAYKIVEKMELGGQPSYSMSLFDKANQSRIAEAKNEEEVIAGMHAFAEELAPLGIAFRIGVIKAPRVKGNRAFKGFDKINLEMIVNEDMIDGVL